MARFQIFLSTRETGAQRALGPAGGTSPLRVVLSALILASVFIAFLIAAVAIGSIVAVLLIALVGVAFTLALIRWAVGRLRRP